ncbi:MAG: hypothetical protein E7082_08485 [Bacteroidales bacterium]|nr:hypothetical protein [Bacteroidales bacterium]
MEEQNHDFSQQLAEAEQRGYQRGLNEQITSKMMEPAVWESNAPEPDNAPREFQILASARKSIWDL